MILLTTTSDVINIVYGAATSAAFHVHASYVDFNGTAITPGRQNTVLSNTSGATTAVVSSPSGSTQRNVKHLSVANANASVSVSLTVQFYNGTDGYQLVKIVLLAGQTLTYSDIDSWLLIDSNGARIDTPFVGRYLGVQVLTSASANFTAGAQTNTIKIRGVGGGGGGGGCLKQAGTNAASTGGGGGAGGYAEKTFAVTPNALYAYTCGALGSGSAGAAGGNGTSSTFVVGSTTVTAFGGTGGLQATNGTGLTAFAGGVGAIVSTNGDVNGGGACGENAILAVIAATPIGASGAGGSTIFGGGGAPDVTNNTAGNNATGHGAGGSGAFGILNATDRAGGNGTAGMWVVEEYS